MTQKSPYRRPGLKLALAASIAAVALLASACSSSSSGGAKSSGGAGTPGGTSAPATGVSAGASSPSADGGLAGMQADLAKFTGQVSSYSSVAPVSGLSALKGKTVWYVPIGSAVPILNGFGVGAEGALAKLGVKVHMCDGKFLPTTIASCLSQAVTQGADGVITSYIDYKLVPTSFDNLVAHKIPVLVAGEANDSGKPVSPLFAFNDTSPSINILQKLSAESVIVDSNSKAKVLFVATTDSSQTLGAAAYAKKFYATNCPGCTFTEIESNTASSNKLPSQVSAALISHPDTTYVVCSLDTAAAAFTGIQSAGFSKKVKLVGANGGLDSLARIKAGQVQTVSVATSPVYLGWQFADGIARMMVGKLPVSGLGIFRIFDKANVGTLTLTPAAYATNAWYGTDAFEQTFTSAWGI